MVSARSSLKRPFFGFGLISAVFLVLLLSPLASAQSCISGGGGVTALLNLLTDILLALLAGLFPPSIGSTPNGFVYDYAGVGVGVNAGVVDSSHSYSFSTLIIGSENLQGDTTPSQFNLAGMEVDLADNKECNKVSSLAHLNLNGGKLFARNGYQVAGKLTVAGATISGKTVRSDPRLNSLPMEQPFRISGQLLVQGLGNQLINGVVFNLLNSQTSTIQAGAHLLLSTGAVVQSTVNSIVNVAGELQVATGSLLGLVLDVSQNGTITIAGTATLTNSGINLAGGLLSIQAGVAADLTSASLNATAANSRINLGSGSSLTLPNGATITIGGFLTNTGGAVSAGPLKAIASSIFSITQSGTLTAPKMDLNDGEINVATGGNVNIGTDVSATGGNIQVNNGLFNAGGALNALGNALLSLTGNSAKLAVTGSTNVIGSALSVVSGAVAQLGDVVATTAEIVVDGASSKFNASSLIASQNTLFNSTGQVSITGQVTQNGGSMLLKGASSALGKLALTAGNVLFSGVNGLVSDVIDISGTGSLALESTNFNSPLANILGGSLTTGQSGSNVIGNILQTAGSVLLQSKLTSENYTVNGGTVASTAPALLEVSNLNIGPALFSVAGILKATAATLAGGSLEIAQNGVANFTSFTQTSGQSTFGIFSSVVAGTINILEGTTLMAGVGDLIELGLEGGRLTVSGQLYAAVHTVAGGVLEVLGSNATILGDILTVTSGNLTIGTGAVVNVLNSSLVGGVVNLLDTTTLNTVNLVSSVPVVVGGVVNSQLTELTSDINILPTGLINSTTSTLTDASMTLAGAVTTTSLTIINSPNTVISGTLTAGTLQVNGGRFVVAAGGTVISSQTLLNSDVFIAGLVKSLMLGNIGNVTLTQNNPEDVAIVGNVTNSGSMTGNGTIDGGLDNNGQVGSESESTVITASRYNQRPSGKVKTVINPEVGSSTFIEAETVVLDGALDVTVSGSPVDGSSYVIMEYSSIQGDFSSVNYQNSDSSQCAAQGQVNKGPTQLTLVFAIPEGCSSQTVDQGAPGALSNGAIAGIAIAGVVVLLAITASIIFGSKSIRKKIMPWRYRG